MNILFSFFTLILILANISIAAETTKYEPPCQDNVQTALDQSIGVYFTENELDYDGLNIQTEFYSADDDNVIYTLDVEGEFSGWIYFSRFCETATVDLPFGEYEISL